MTEPTDTEMVTKHYVVCDECDAHYESSPTNCVTVTDFNFCPNCGTELPDGNPREIEHRLGWIPNTP